ncbi:MAG: archease [Theionarchaea archaeon]|nr:archease [Theionarchaea archaeon]
MKEKKFEFLDHEADIGIRSWGKTVEEAFENGGRALFAVMVNVDSVEPQQVIPVKAQADDLDTLYVEWLNELIAQKDIQEMVFSEFSVHIDGHRGVFTLTGTAQGELLHQVKHEIKTEVKAATYFGMKSEKKDGLYFFQCVLDI